ncbi:MAG: S6e family ribosomal protein [Nitrososphaeraceae archaeon]
MMLVNFKLVLSDKKGKSISYELKDNDAQPLLGSKIGDSFDSTIVGLSGGKFKITGGSDKSGTPMRRDIHGGVKKYALIGNSVGMRDSTVGKRIRKLLRGNMITEDIYQLNCKLEDVFLPESTPNNSKTESKTE